MHRILLARIALFAVLLHVSSHASAITCYVNSAATGGDGTTWAKAFTDLQTQLAIAGCSEIWVARGTYKPTATNDRTISFNIQPGVVVYGGFAGTEAMLDARLLPANPTVLSGDIGTAGDSSDNSHHVVVLDGTTAAGPINAGTLLSDLTIRDGNANSGAFGANRDRGGGLFCKGSGAAHECSPALENLIFENNYASNFGGALYNAGASSGKASPQMRNVILRDNSAAFGGGAMYNDGITLGASNPLINNATFSGNSSATGGAIFNAGAGGTSNPTIRNSTFYANTASQTGGAIANSGQTGGHASPVLRYVTFSQNRAMAGAGGAIYNFASNNGDAAPNISGAIFWADQATAAPVEMATTSPTTPSIEYSITPECPPAAVGCTNADPLLGPLQDNDGFAPTLRPDVGSPAIDNGNVVNCPAVDERGIARPQGAQCDIGAVELRASETRRCYVNGAAAGNNGLSWATAYLGLGSALADANCTEVWVAKGTYYSSDFLLGSAFFMPSGKAVYGGFAGTETARSQRDPVHNETILDGAATVYHVVTIDATANAAFVSGSTIVDGFTITGGNANGPGIHQFGGGLICNGAGYTCNPTLANLVFKNNSAVYGGALMNRGEPGGMSSPRLQTVTFSANHATTDGGAVYNDGLNGVSSPTFTAVDFNGNTANHYGGAMYNAGSGGVSSPSVVASHFNGNGAKFGGAVFNSTASSSFTEVIFSGNQASSVNGFGGAVYSIAGGGPANLQFASVTFAGNSAYSGGAVFNSDAGQARFDQVAFEGNILSGASGCSCTGGAVVNNGDAVFHDALFARNGGPNAYFGGAIYNASGESGATANLTIDGASFVGNIARNTGAVFTQSNTAGSATALISNATFWENRGYTEAGAISVNGLVANHSASIVLRNVTLLDNVGIALDNGALEVFSSNSSYPATATISNTIFWGDSYSSGAEMSISNGTTVAIDHSIVQNGCPGGATCNTVSSADPLFELFQLYGGITPALMPAANSPALNVGASCTATDQRGVARPQGPGCDIGAVERRATEDYLFNDGFDW